MDFGKDEPFLGWTSYVTNAKIKNLWYELSSGVEVSVWDILGEQWKRVNDNSSTDNKIRPTISMRRGLTDNENNSIRKNRMNELFTHEKMIVTTMTLSTNWKRKQRNDGTYVLLGQLCRCGYCRYWYFTTKILQRTFYSVWQNISYVPNK